MRKALASISLIRSCFHPFASPTLPCFGLLLASLSLTFAFVPTVEFEGYNIDYFFFGFTLLSVRKKKAKKSHKHNSFSVRKKANDDRIQECTRSVHAEYLFFSCMLYVWEKLLGGRRMG